jgi:hypothetical protein
MRLNAENAATAVMTVDSRRGARVCRVVAFAVMMANEPKGRGLHLFLPRCSHRWSR